MQLLAGFVVLTPTVSRAADAPEQNTELVGQSDLNGNGDGGEGMAIACFIYRMKAIRAASALSMSPILRNR
jgi:hypothetical protein